MAIAQVSATAWVGDNDYDEAVTSSTFSVSANDVVVVSARAGEGTVLTISTTLSGMSWTSAFSQHSSTGRVYIWIGRSTSAQSSKTVTVTANGFFSYPLIQVQVFSGVKTSGTWYYGSHGGSGATSVPFDLPQSPRTPAGSGEVLVLVANDYGSGTVSSTEATLTNSASNTLTSGYRAIPSGEDCETHFTSTAGSPSIAYQSYVLVPESSATSHEATATRATTVSLSAAANATRSASASVATAASLSGAVAVGRPASASVASTVTITASAEVVRSASVALASTATFTAEADVESADETATATVATTATITATASVARVASASLATTAGITAEAELISDGEQSADAAVASTATITATASVVRVASASLATTVTVTATGALPTDESRGLMAGITRARATMTPITGAGNLPRRISLRAIDTATMTALLATTEVPALAGVPVFIGGDESPAAVGLVAAGVAYLWISDGVVYYEDGS